MAHNTQAGSGDGQSARQTAWDKALSTLQPEVRARLGSTTANQKTVLSTLLQDAFKAKNTCVLECWTLKKSTGETIILRDVVEKIITWVEKFVAVGDAAMQYDPVHAAPAWAAIRFILQVLPTIHDVFDSEIDFIQISVNDKKAFHEMIENLEFVSHLITRYAVLEQLYLQQSSATAAARIDLEDLIIQSYAEILIFLANAKTYFHGSAKGKGIVC